MQAYPHLLLVIETNIKLNYPKNDNKVLSSLKVLL